MKRTDTAGSKPGSSARKRNGRKRPRKEDMKKRSSLMPFTAAGILALCCMNSARDHPTSFAFAFFHPTSLPSIERKLKCMTTNKNEISIRKNNRYFHNKKSTTSWILSAKKSRDFGVMDDMDGSWKTDDDIESRNNGSLVFTSSSSSPSLPPWLACSQEELTDLSSREASKRIRREIELLESLLATFRGGSFFSKANIKNIIRAIYWCASSNSKDRSMSEKVSKIVGCVSFCKLLLQLEDDTFDMKKNQQYIFDVDNKKIKDDKGYLISQDVLLASILHYSECFDLRYDGVYDEVQNIIHKNSFVENVNNDFGSPLTQSTIPSNENTENASLDKKILPSQDASIVLRREPIDKNTNEAFENIFSPQSLKLANAATRLKRIEILTSVTLTSDGDQGMRRRPLSSGEYAAARNLMVSLTDDWRALAIRCTASLFRLNGILKHSKVNAGIGDFSIRRDAETTLTAKDSLKMYANLSQQMGLHRLHSQLEGKAFQILYPRQYSASSALFQEHGAAMNAISGFLSNQLNQMLSEDLSLMYELEHLEVASRVKQPFSFWKKLLKTRVGTIALSVSNDEQRVDSKDEKRSTSIVKRNAVVREESEIVPSSSDLSILDVNDGVALRVIFKARKLHVDESPETTRERERLLCYYIHHMVRTKWPETDQSKVKDYVRYPKPNGYQSLHHTSKITRNKQDFHFEVQVRSEDMHRVAEFGVAAHSTYKLGGNNDPNTLLSLKASPNSSSLSLVSSTASSSVSKRPGSSNQPSELTILSRDEKSPFDATVIGMNDSEDSGPYINALAKSRQSLVQSQVYVFLAGGSSSTLENGQLITLSAGSLIRDVVDTLREVNEEFEFENHEINVWRNGNVALLEQNIENGDMILIQPTPSSVTPITEILVNKTSSNTLLVGSSKGF